MSRLPDPNEIVYIRCVVSQVLTSDGRRGTVLARPVNDQGAIDEWMGFGTDIGVHPETIVYPKEKLKWRPPTATP